MLIERFGLAARDWIEAGCRLAVQHNHRHVTPFHLLAHAAEGKVSGCDGWLTAAGADLVKPKQVNHVEISAVAMAEAGAGNTPINRHLESVLIAAEQLVPQVDGANIQIAHILGALVDFEPVGHILVESGAELPKLKQTLAAAQLKEDGGANCAAGEYLARYSIDLSQAAKDGQLDDTK